MFSKSVMLSLALTAAVLAAGGVPPAQAQVTQRNSSQMDRQSIRSDQAATKHVKASSLIGMKVRGLNGEDNIGSINDLVIGNDGNIEYVAVAFGGFLGVGDKLFAVPFEAIDWVKTDDDAFARIDVTEKTLNQKKGFNQDTWPAEADRSFSTGTLRRQAAR